MNRAALRALTEELGVRVLGDLVHENTSLGYWAIVERGFEAQVRLKFVGIPGNMPPIHWKWLARALGAQR